MRRIVLIFAAFLFFVLPVSAQFDDIQKDVVDVDQFISGASAQVEDNLDGEHIKVFESNIDINEDGSINVKETIVYDFNRITRHGIYRDIPYIRTNQDGQKYKLDFDNFQVIDEYDNDYIFKKLSSGEKINLKIGDPNHTITGVHTYIISYQVKGALTYFSDHDELYWNITGSDWQVPIALYTAAVSWPQKLQEDEIKATCYTGVFGSTQSDCNQSYSEGKILVTSSGNLAAGEGATLVVSFPKGIATVLEPEKYVPFWQTWAGKLVGLALGLLAVMWYIGAPIYIIYRWFKYGRDPKPIIGVATAWYDPPKIPGGKRFLTPGEVGTLGDETVDMKDISSTIVDLARRGYLIIDERKKGDFWLIRSSFPKKGDGGLLQYERKLIDGFFGSKKEIRLKDQHLFNEVQDVTSSLYEDVVKIGLFPKNPQTIRTIYYVIAGVALFTGNFMLALISFIFGRVMPRKTQEGAETFAVAKSLKNFLTSQQRQLEFQASKQMMFERLLPYAVAFGVERVWAKRFKDIDLKAPDWYRGYSSNTFNSYIFVNSLNSSMKSFQVAATPTRSSSGFSSGFGGGGFSGGGGGGGGGGSW